MKFDFDKIIERKNTHSIKYDFAKERGLPEDLLPLWVADMDFSTPDCVVDALVEKSRHGIFGYSEVKEEYFSTLQAWFLRHYDWTIRPEWLVKTPGVVFAICAAIRAFTDEGDAVLIQPPVYYPFAASVRVNRRRLVTNPLVLKDGRYHIDFEDFEQKIAAEKVKLFVLCNPHNPVGRVWTCDELTQIGEICRRHGVLIVSDEIHADFVYGERRHIPIAGLRPDFSDRTITCTAPSKTFNLAGLQVSNILIENDRLRRELRTEIQRTGYSQMNTMALVACQAAYEGGEEWLLALRQYLSDTVSFVERFLNERLPNIRLIRPEGTYLLWLDFRGLPLSEKEREDRILKQAKLWLDTGGMFGEEGAGFERMNIAAPRSIINQALLQLESAFKDL